jgi:prepilin-type N-terminal cleavage/methylation domain-containing protein
VAKEKIEKGKKMKTEKNKKAFTLVELLTAVVIIAILIGVLVPALNMARNFARDAKQRVQIQSIEASINMYRNDFGEYPPSHGCNFGGGQCNPEYGYCGAQTLTEALLGQDLLGFHPDSIYREDGHDASTPSNALYNPAVPTQQVQDNLRRRQALYIQRENIGVFRPDDIYDTVSQFLHGDHFVLCDTFEKISRNIGGGNRSFRIGTPILYFRANTSAANTELQPNDPVDNIYNYQDNQALTDCGQIKNNSERHELETEGGNDPTPFYDIISDPMTVLRRPVRPDSFLLISAGQDGIYGTRDDICNFDPNTP